MSKVEVECYQNLTTFSSTITYILSYQAMSIYDQHFSVFAWTDAHTRAVVPYWIMSVGHGADACFLALSPQVTLVINAVVGCHYFPPGPWLLHQPKRSSPWPLPNYTAWWQRHRGVSSFSKATMQIASSMHPCVTWIRCLILDARMASNIARFVRSDNKNHNNNNNSTKNLQREHCSTTVNVQTSMTFAAVSLH